MSSKQDPVRAVEDERGLRPTLTEAEHDAIEFAVETGRVAIHDDAILRNLLERTNHDAVPAARAEEPESSVPRGSGSAPANTHDRPKPIKDDVSDRPKPINDERLAALEELSALDQKLELEYGITGNPMIKAQQHNESAGAGIRNAGPRLRQINDVLEENERLRGQLAMAERERDSLRVAINNLRDYVAELNAELFAAETEPTQPRNGAPPDGPDPDSRVWETPCTPHPHATTTQGSVQGEGSVSRSGTENEPVAWAVVSDSKEEIDCDFVYPDETTAGDFALDMNGGVVPLYRSPTLTDAEREAIEAGARIVAEFEDEMDGFPSGAAATLRKLLERLK